MSETTRGSARSFNFLESVGTIEDYLVCNKIKAPHRRLYPHLTGKAGKTTDLERSTTTLSCIL